MNPLITRRSLTKMACLGLLMGSASTLIGCDIKENEDPEKDQMLPSSSPDSNDPFGIDTNINMETIDEFLWRDDVAYRDMRLLFDPAKYSDIGGDSDIADTLEGFKIVPYPYVATLPSLPVSGAYDGDTLFTLTFDENGSITEAIPNYEESMLFVEDLFPKNKAIFLTCGGAGYAAMMKDLLIYLGWSAEKLFNIGGMWSYKGYRTNALIEYPQDPNGEKYYATWRADYAYIDFAHLHLI